MEFYLPTYDECKAIVESCDGLQFYESTQEIDGYKICTFNYRLANFNDFFGEKIEIEENGEKIFLLGLTKINDKKISDYTDEELAEFGFEFLSKFKI